MDRRKFIKGAVAVAVAAALPGGDGVALQSVAHPTFSTVAGASLTEKNLEQVSIQYSRALAHSMMQTKEIVARNVLNRAFSNE